VSAEGGVQGILREQARTLATIAAQLSKLEERTPALASIEKMLVAIEMHLRNLSQTQKVQQTADQPVSRQQRSG
jgi:trehalose-6-phosphatase